MRYRWKILILFLTIAMVPIMVIRTVGIRSVRRLGNELVLQARANRISGLQRQIQQLVTGYAAVLQAGREQIDMALLLQTRAVEQALARPAEPGAKIYTTEDFNSGAHLPPDTTLSSFQFRSRPDESIDPLKVSYAEQVFKLAAGADPKQMAEDAARLASLTPLCKQISDRLTGLVFWQNTGLANGLYSSYPGHNGIPRRFDPREQPWYRHAPESGESWSAPYIDPETRQVVVAAVASVKRPDGTTAGVTSLVVPVSSLLDRRLLFQNIPPETGSFIVYPVKREDSGKIGARIFARDEYIGVQHRNWRAQMGSEWLESGDGKQAREIIRDLEAGVGGVRRMPYKGKESLWVYGPVHRPSALVLITPYEEILKPAERARQYMNGQIDGLLRYTRYHIYGTILLVTILAFAFSRSVTRPIRQLAQGAGRLAAGRFDSRVEIRTRDEFGDMGKVFNSIGPRLKELYQVRHSLALAMEVQQNLLPRRIPQVSGLDIAGTSIYCDETGGDYYDFYEDSSSESKRIAAVVGDVSDHGIPSALLMTTARAFLKQRASRPGSIRDIVIDVNNLLARDVRGSGRFMTLFYAQIDPHERRIRWVRAGHEPAWLYDPASDTFSELGGNGLPLGAFENSEYEEMQRTVAAGQVFVIGTDGIWEATNSEGAAFGKEALRRIIRAEAGKPAGEILSAVIEAVNRFRSDFEQKDDITLVVIKIESGGKDCIGQGDK